MLPTANQIELAVGCVRAIAQAIAQPLQEACKLYSINTGPRLAAFLAQTGHESASFTRTRENLNYSAEALQRTWPSRFTKALAEQVARKPQRIAEIVYTGRLGNRSASEAWAYIGRGYVQITGRSNYEAITETLRERLPAAPDFAMSPELLESPKWAALSAAAYWDDHDLNELADRGQFDRITTRINGGQIGKADRRARYARAMRALAQ